MVVLPVWRGPKRADDVADGLGQPLDEGVDLGALEGLHAREITLLSNFTQWHAFRGLPHASQGGLTGRPDGEGIPSLAAVVELP